MLKQILDENEKDKHRPIGRSRNWRLIAYPGWQTTSVKCESSKSKDAVVVFMHHTYENCNMAREGCTHSHVILYSSDLIYAKRAERTVARLMETDSSYVLATDHVKRTRSWLVDELWYIQDESLKSVAVQSLISNLAVHGIHALQYNAEDSEEERFAMRGQRFKQIMDGLREQYAGKPTMEEWQRCVSTTLAKTDMVCMKKRWTEYYANWPEYGDDGESGGRKRCKVTSTEETREDGDVTDGDGTASIERVQKRQNILLSAFAGMNSSNNAPYTGYSQWEMMTDLWSWVNSCVIYTPPSKVLLSPVDRGYYALCVMYVMATTMREKTLDIPHIYIYGPPATGKSIVANLIERSSKLKSVKVVEEDKWNGRYDVEEETKYIVAVSNRRCVARGEWFVEINTTRQAMINPGGLQTTLATERLAKGIHDFLVREERDGSRKGQWDKPNELQAMIDLVKDLQYTF